MAAVTPVTLGFPTNQNISNSSDYDYNYDYNYDGKEPCDYVNFKPQGLVRIYSIFFTVGLLGNSVVVWVISCGARLRSMTDVCLLNLAIADILLSCSLPFLVYQAYDQWVFGETICKIVLITYNIVFYSGIFFVTLMSIDRYLAIVHAVYATRIRTQQFGIAAALVTWVIGVMASFPDILYLKQDSNGSVTHCFPEYPAVGNNHHFWRVLGLFKMNILGLIIPLVIMGFCYSQIILRLLYSPSSKRQTIQLVVTVVVVFFCCWVPYNITVFFKALELLDLYTSCEASKSIHVALQVTEIIAYLHTCLNPFLYVFVGRKFRQHLWKLIDKVPCHPCRMISVILPQDRLRRSSAMSQTSSLDERSTGI
ncbi:C-C chemokine receptor type 3 [Synchiropus splendidus]|uniref:C-C chemokine receptor type 3 n=1 Tax=Synchiropus splendidus TaxID=270530 RepID=UPI00237E2A35|nr:C-C chemokine receptor type 3 [Synchiropus splendidus]